jgi:selenocysteine lyase/cysteine desulfurase
MRHAAAIGATTLLPSTHRGPELPAQEYCLLENATVATCAVAYHWSKMIQPGDVIVHLDVAYKACIHILNEYCVRQGARLVSLHIPFPATTAETILCSFNDQLEQLAHQGIYPRFAFLDQVSSQPAILLPLEEMIRLVRQHGEAFDQEQRIQVCVDAAHAVGSVSDLDVTRYDCDYYYSNLHKWGFAPSTATIFWSPYCTEMRHPITSWAWGKGLCEDAVFSGTRDYSAMAAVPAAVDYLRSWRCPTTHDQTSAEFCHSRVLEAARFLRDAWDTNELDPPTDDDLIATQAMIRLPTGFDVTDRPGQVSRGVRDRLRDEYQIEAAVGNFGDKGNYLRLSWAIYNNMQEIERLADAVLEIRHGQ